jgi:ribose transport system permease protein
MSRLRTRGKDPDAPAIDAASQGKPPRRVVDRIPESGALLVVLGALIVFFTIESPYFFNTDNFINILIASAVVGVVACPATMLLIAGQFDLSVGGATALVSCIFAQSLPLAQSTASSSPSSASTH